MRRIVGISVAAVVALPLAIGSYGVATAGEQNVPARHSAGLLGSKGLLGLGEGDGLLGTGLLSSGDKDSKKERSKKARSKKERRDRDHKSNSIAGLDLLGDDLLGLTGEDGGLLGGEDGLLGTGLLGGGDKRDRDGDRNGSKRHYDSDDDDNGSNVDDDDFPFGD